jgi:hypothetical protein
METENTLKNLDKKIREIEFFLDAQFKKGSIKIKNLLNKNKIPPVITIDDIDLHADPVVLEKINYLDNTFSTKHIELQNRITLLENRLDNVVSIFENDFITHKSRFDKIYDYLASFNETLKNLDVHQPTDDSERIENLAINLNLLNTRLEKLENSLNDGILCIE